MNNIPDIKVGLDPKAIGYNRPAGSLYESENPWGTL